MEQVVKISVLGYEEDDMWVAHALELDVIGVDETFEKAFAVLKENVKEYMSFAKSQDDESLTFHPAPDELFDSFHEVKRLELQAMIMSRNAAEEPRQFMSGILDVSRSMLKGQYAPA